MVELQIVVLAVAGSSPVGHPAIDFGLYLRWLFVRIEAMAIEAGAKCSDDPAN
jgi:hypothetical protein